MSLFSQRHSTRRFLDEPIDDGDVRAILTAGTLAPSSGNHQPWRFFVLANADARRSVADVMRNALEQSRLETNRKLSAQEKASVATSAEAIEQASVVVLIYCERASAGENANDVRLVDVEGIGACVQNMALAATALGVSSLWICDVLYVEKSIDELLDTGGQRLLAALALGYEDKSCAQGQVPRLGVDDVILGMW